MKRVTIKQMQESGWYEFVQWAIKEGLTTKQLNNYTLCSWASYKAMQLLLIKVERDMYSSDTVDFGLKYDGIKKQIKSKR